MMNLLVGYCEILLFLIHPLLLFLSCFFRLIRSHPPAVVVEKEEEEEEITGNDVEDEGIHHQNQKKKKKKGKRKKTKFSNLPHLPESLIVDHILTRLPVKSLMRFRSVCKSWNSIFLHKNPDFISLHMTNYYLTPHSHPSTCILSPIYGLKYWDPISSISLLSFRYKRNRRKPNALPYLHALVVRDLDISAAQIPHDFMPGDLLCCCHGILCLGSVYYHNIALWNPITRDFKRIPPSFSFTPYGYYRSISNELIQMDHLRINPTIIYSRGIGFDSKTNDYKILEILIYRGIDTPVSQVSQVGVYTLSTNSWKVLDDVRLFDDERYTPPCILSVPCKNDRFLFLERHSWRADSAPCMLVFDMCEEVFQTIRPPADIAIGVRVIPVPWYDESIALVEYTSTAPPDDFFTVWVMDEFGVEEVSWTKVASYGPVSTRNYPQGFWKNGEIVFTKKEPDDHHCTRLKLSSYNPLGPNRFRDLGNKDSSTHLTIFRESLVSLC